MTGFPRAGGLRLIRLVLVAVAVGVTLNSAVAVSQFVRGEQRDQATRKLTLQTRHDAHVTTAALCALRGDLERRVASSRAFLAEHPDGIPGISAKVIRDGLRNQESTIRALSGIDCPTNP